MCVTFSYRRVIQSLESSRLKRRFAKSVQSPPLLTAVMGERNQKTLQPPQFTYKWLKDECIVIRMYQCCFMLTWYLQIFALEKPYFEIHNVDSLLVTHVMVLRGLHNL